MSLQILSAGAAQGLVRSVEPLFRSATGLDVAGSFGAVGAMREKFLAGEPCDVLILTQALIEELTRANAILGQTCAALGQVRTGIAVCNGAPAPAIADVESVRHLLRDASEIFFPDPQRATAGIHFMKVLRILGLDAEVASRLRSFPNGAAAMRAMADGGNAGSVGCTQITEILYTSGVRLAGPLPAALASATVYTAAVVARARRPQEARVLIDLMTRPEAEDMRRQCGFDEIP
jgi:molybdate transport system substrate-binding protein